MAENTGCFERFFMSVLAVVAAIAVTAAVAIFGANRVTAQNSDYSQYKNGKLYLINPVAQVTIYTMLDVPRIQDGLLCTTVDQYEVEMCFPLTNVAGMTLPLN